MRTTRQCAKEWRTRFGPARTLAVVFVLTVFSAWIPAQAGEPSSSGKVLQIDIRGLRLLLQSDPNALLIDVRTPGELTGPLGKIFEARNVPLNKIEKNPEQFPRDKTLVLIDRSGRSSLKAARLLAAHGYVVYSVEGGMEAWRRLHPLVQPPAEGASPKKPGVSGSPAGKKQPSPEKNFFDNNLGC
jgi:rhodanese-related sulfurtransferase